MQHIVDGLLYYRVPDVYLTAAEYARQWERTIKGETERRQELMLKHKGEDLAVILVNEFQGFVRLIKKFKLKTCWLPMILRKTL